MSEFNIYCDESCHLEHDGHRVMVFGALSCPKELAYSVFQRIREIKKRHQISRDSEIKFHKVSKSKNAFYQDIVDFYFDHPNLGFRALVVADKSCLNHSKYSQTHDDFYYKMYFDLLKVLFDPAHSYNIYLDIKDTRGSRKIKKLHEILCTKIYDLKKEVIRQIQVYPSDQLELIQICDLLIGAIGYHNRGEKSNIGKLMLISRIQERSGYSLKKTTLLRESKMNLLIWGLNNQVSE